MRVIALGHAALRLETETTAVLVDPWFDPEGAFLGSWFPMPDNAGLLAQALEGVSAVVLTHEHRDHFDPWLLAQLPPAVPVIVPKYPSPRFSRFVADTGREVIEASTLTPTTVGPITLHFMPECSPMNHDCAVGFEAEGTTVLNLNDARINPLQLRMMRDALGGRVDVLFAQTSGASWYPIRYRYPRAVLDELVEKKRGARLAYALGAARVVAARTTVPYAGPPCFLDPALADANEQLLGGMFPQQGEAAEFLAASGLDDVRVLDPGDTWERGTFPVSRPRAQMCSDGLYAYLETYRDRRFKHIARAIERAPTPRHDLDGSVDDYFTRLVRMNPYFSARIGMRLGLDITGPHGGEWTVDFTNAAHPVEPGLGHWRYLMRFESRWLLQILDEELLWEDLLLSLRVELDRTPDRYNDHLLGLLKFADVRALEAVERYECDESSRDWISISTSEGRVLRVERTCPHAGNDLSDLAELDLEAGTLRCLAHHYEFDIETGACVNATCRSLRIELEADPAPEPQGARLLTETGLP